jgi:ABC-2 type transport system permease protein
MMLRSIFTKTLYDQRRGLLGWSVALVLLVAMYVAVWPSVRDQPSVSDFLDQMPEAFRSLFATSGADMSTPVGYVQIELLSFMGPIAMLIYAIGAGVGAIA